MDTAVGYELVNCMRKGRNAAVRLFPRTHACFAMPDLLGKPS